MAPRSLRPLLVPLWLALVAASTNTGSERLAGRWEGAFHGGRGDQPVAIVCRPRGSSGFTGTFYLDGTEVGPIEDGACSGDSLWFRVASYACAARLGDQGMGVTLTLTHGRTHAFVLTHTAADTIALSGAASGPAPPSRDVAPDSVFVAHRIPDGPISSTHPCLKNGTLILVGGGPSQEDIQARFLTLAGGDHARIVAIPTASAPSFDPAALAQFSAAVARKLSAKDVVALHTFSRRQADSASFVAPLERATGAWIAGGEGSWLLDSYLGTRTERELVALLERGGVISGTSAGALIWGSRTMTFHARPGVSEATQFKPEDLVLEHARSPGIGLLRNVMIVPHFTEHRLEAFTERTVQAHPGLLALGIDEATAAEVHGAAITVLGRGHVTVYDGRDHDGKPSIALVARDRYDLVRRVRL